MRIIDLTHTITPETPVYPGDRPLRLFQERFLHADGFNAFRLETNMHAGTHIDCPPHMTPSRAMACELPLEKFCGEGRLIDARGKTAVTAGDVGGISVNAGDVVLVLTGFDVFYGQSRYYAEHPVIDESLAALLIERKVGMLGVDCPSPDVSPYPVHKLLLSNGIPIIENLTNLSALLGVKRFTLLGFPLKLEAEASLARVAALVDE